MTTQCDRTVAEGLVHDHIPLVGHIVREILSRVPDHVRRDELVSAGLLALVNASQIFEKDRGVPFTQYAALRIRGGILDELRAMDWATRSVRRRDREIEAARSRLISVLGRTPTKREVAEAAHMTLAALVGHEQDLAQSCVVAIDAFDSDSGPRLLSTASPAPISALLHREELAYLDTAIQQLPARLRVVVEGYFLREQPMAELAIELNVTESRISQMRAEALSLVKAAMTTLLYDEVVPLPEVVVGIKQRRRAAYVLDVAQAHRPRPRVA